MVLSIADKPDFSFRNVTQTGNSLLTRSSRQAHHFNLNPARRVMVSQLEVLDVIQGILPGRFAGDACGQNQTRAIVGARELCRHQQDMLPQRLQGGCV